MMLLIKLTRKDQVFKWGKEQQEAFESIKILFTNDSILQSHDPEGRLTMEIIKSEKVLQEYDLK